MEEQAQKTYKNCRLVGSDFYPCVENGEWLVSRWDVIHTNSGKKAVYLFSIRGTEASTYDNKESNFTLKEFVMDTLISHIEENGFNPELFRFEFNKGSYKFQLCHQKPEWTNYDCGQISL